MKIIEVTEPDEKSKICEEILRQLPDWFGIEEAILDYVQGVRDKIFFAAFSDETCLGFFAGEIHFNHVGEIYVCGVKPESHRQGLGAALYQQLEEYFLKQNCDNVLVETISERHPSTAYAKTRNFYKKIGFEPLIELPELWGEANPCLLMQKRLK